jgi:hypothetical protein
MIPDPLDRAAEALRNHATPPGPSPELTVRTLAAMAARAHPVHPARRRFIMRLLGYGSLATAAAVLVGVGVAFFGTSRHSTAAEFQQAMAKAAKAKNLVVTSTQRLMPDRPEMTMTMTLQDSFVRVDFPNPGAEGGPSVKDVPILVTMIADQKTGTALHIQHASKTAQFDKIPDRPGATGFPDLVAGFRHLAKAEGITAAGDETIDSVATKKYTLKTAEFLGGKGPCDVTVWIEPKSQWPVKVSLEFDVMKRDNAQLVPSGQKALVVFSDFRFDGKLPEHFFKQEAPSGYPVTTVERDSKTGETRPKK